MASRAKKLGVFKQNPYYIRDLNLPITKNYGYLDLSAASLRLHRVVNVTTLRACYRSQAIGKISTGTSGLHPSAQPLTPAKNANYNDNVVLDFRLFPEDLTFDRLDRNDGGLGLQFLPWPAANTCALGSTPLKSALSFSMLGRRLAMSGSPK